MRTFREFITLCEQTYDKEMGQTVKKIGTGVKVGAERKKTDTRKEKNESKLAVVRWFQLKSIKQERYRSAEKSRD